MTMRSLRSGMVTMVAWRVKSRVFVGSKYARIWGQDVFAGQQVHATHVLSDRNVVELHA